MGDGGDGVWWVKIGCQEGLVEVTLDGTDTARTNVKPLIEEFPDVRPATMTVLGQLGGACRELVQGAAGTRNRASQVVYQHPWGT